MMDVHASDGVVCILSTAYMPYEHLHPGLVHLGTVQGVPLHVPPVGGCLGKGPWGDAIRNF